MMQGQGQMVYGFPGQMGGQMGQMPMVMNHQYPGAGVMGPGSMGMPNSLNAPSLGAALSLLPGQVWGEEKLDLLIRMCQNNEFNGAKVSRALQGRSGGLNSGA